MRRNGASIRLYLSMSVFVIVIQAAIGSVVHVPADQPTIQAGIDAAVAGDEVVIADGTYTGDGNRDLDFGGKAITVRSESGDPALCVIDCESTGRGFYFSQAEGPDSIVDGLTISNGYVDENSPGGIYSVNGGGIFCKYASPTISNCVLTGNSAANNGGGAYCRWSNTTFTGCTFCENIAAEDGGGMHVEYYAMPKLTNCLFLSNRGNGSFSYGGGVCVDKSTPDLNDCTFISNRAWSGGGLGNQWSASSSLSHCEFINNKSSYGGGIRNWQNCHLSLIACTLRENTAGTWGGGLCNNEESDAVVIDSSFIGNMVSGTNSMGGGIFNHNQSDLVLLNCTLNGNTGEYGGGIHNDASDLLSVNCVFSGNYADNNGGGMCNTSSSPELVNCTFSNNTALFKGGGMHNELSEPVLTNCILWGNGEEISDDSPSMTITYSCVRGGYPGVGNVSRSPQFLDPDGPDDQLGTADDDLRLAADSPCNNMGMSSEVPADSFDLDGDGDMLEPIPFDRDGANRFIDTVDIGAYEHVVPLDPPVVPSRLYVNVNSLPGGDGSSWDSALIHLQDALDLAVAGTEIWVAVGTYYPDRRNMTPSGTGDRNDSFWLHDGVKVYGGFSGDESWIFHRPDDPDHRIADPVYDTILSGDIGVEGDDTDNSFSVVRSHYISTETILNRVSIIDGHSEHYRNGAGMRNYNASPTISDCLFSSNNSDNSGGGMLNINSSCPVITNCFFGWNYATYRGGGMKNQDSSNPTISNSTFWSNSTSQVGAGMSNSSSSPVLTECTFHKGRAKYAAGIANYNSNPLLINCTISENTASSINGYGGGMYNNSSNPVLEGCTILENSAGINGGGMYNVEDSTPTLLQCTISGNTAEEDGAGIANDSSSPILRSCLLQENTAGLFGGGIYNIASSPILSDCSFLENTASSGGGMYNTEDSCPELTRCSLTGNEADTGGGIYCWRDSSPILTFCTFTGNSDSGFYSMSSTIPQRMTGCVFMGNTANNGGGIQSFYTSVELINCAFLGNSAYSHGGGIYINGQEAALMATNCTFSGCVAEISGGALYNRSNILHVANCVISGDDSELVDIYYAAEFSVTYSLVQGGSGENWFGVGCIDTDPMFVDADGEDDDPGTMEDNDYRLSSGSPCIDAGDNYAVPADEFDLDGDGDTAEPVPQDLRRTPRFQDDPDTEETGNGVPPIVDMGAYEYRWLPSIDLDGNGVVDYNDYLVFSLVLSGPGEPTYYESADLDNDGDVDLGDFSLFQQVFANSIVE